MAVGEARQQVTAAKGGNVISQVSWTDGVAQDIYYGLDHSFQYSSNINTDDELHGIKLASKTSFTTSFAKCQLVSLGEHGVMALPVNVQSSADIKLNRMQYNGFYDPDGDTRQDGPEPLDDGEPVSKWSMLDDRAGTLLSSKYKTVPGVVFQNNFWFGANLSTSSQNNYGYIHRVPLAVTGTGHGEDAQDTFLPYDHNDYTDESIEDANDRNGIYTLGNITAILNYNNTRLVVACGNEIWVYYPELDDRDKHGTNYYGQTGWKRVLNYEAGVTVVALTCTFEYLKVRAVDEGWNTKVYYYQGNNNLRSTFVYNVVDLTGVRVLHVYSINGVDYYTSSIGEYASDALIDLNKMVGITPVKLFSQRAGMTVFDVNNKAPYFVGPTSISGAYNNGNIYISDAYGVFRFRYNPTGFDKGYMRRLLNNNKQVYGLCENKGFLYVSDEDGCRAMRLYDTGVDGYQDNGVLISREFEGREGGTVTKMLDEIRMNFELNPMIDPSEYGDNTEPYGEIEVYVSPNNKWKTASIGDFTEENNWFRVMHITKTSAGTRTEKSNLFNDLGSRNSSSFKFDWQTITYAIVITRGEEPRATPIVRELKMTYHCKDKTNNVYDIK